MSIVVVTLIIRRSLQPLGALATQASLVSPSAWNFKAPDSAYELSELAPLASALDIALQGLERAFRQQRGFVNDAAHELKTAVTVLKSSLQLLTLRDRTKNQYQAGIESCLADCGRMEELVQRMLLLARVENAPLPASTQGEHSVLLANLLRQTVNQLEPAAYLRQITLTTQIEEDPSTRLGDEDCTTLLVNLIMNAIQHSGAGSTVVTRLRRLNDSKTELAIADKGEGIAAEHLPFLFDRFYRADASRSRETGGTGLGLAICKAIVESNGGTIRIESQLTVGTTVIVTLPAAASDGNASNLKTSNDRLPDEARMRGAEHAGSSSSQ